VSLQVPVHDQPDDIEHQIEALIMKYIQVRYALALARRHVQPRARTQLLASACWFKHDFKRK
jgi:hypothetical protein